MDSIVRNNLMSRPGYAPYCGSDQCSCGTPRATWDINRQQFTCRCGWVSAFDADFVREYVRFRIDSQVCLKCGVTVGARLQKYCGDGRDKDNAHAWVMPADTGATV